MDVGGDVAVWSAQEREERCDEVAVDGLGELDGGVAEAGGGVEGDDVIGELVAVDVLEESVNRWK